MLTILLAWPSPPPALAVSVRPAYFALLFWFFRRTTRESPEVEGQAMRLVRAGFFVLFLSFTIVAVVHFAELEPVHPAFVYLREVCEQGAMFLLGTSLISYGLMIWIPQVLANHRLLAQHYAQQRGMLQLSESARSQLEQRLVDADRRGLLGELAATIAHDLRNPLAIVKGTAESLCRKPRSPHEVQEHTDVIRRNIEKADRTIASLIDLGRPRSHAPAMLTARAVLGEIAHLVHVEARRRRLRIEVAIDAGSGEPAICADHTLLAQALLNLVLNAVQATPRDGRIILRGRAWRTGAGTCTSLSVEDRGHGITKEARSHLFTPFFTTKATGTGLGLSSCRRIAGELGGRLDLYPRTRGGARALLLLPSTLPADSPVAASIADEGATCSPTC
jgi:signal transduction histidine kinase